MGKVFLQNKLLVFCVGHMAMQATPVILEDVQICFSEKVCFVGQINTEKIQAIFHDKKDPANFKFFLRNYMLKLPIVEKMFFEHFSKLCGSFSREMSLMSI